MRAMPRPRLFTTILIAGLFVWFFGDAIVRDATFAFRDAAHFYYPLFEFIGRQWSTGRLPLWNPYGNGGNVMVMGRASADTGSGAGGACFPPSAYARTSSAVTTPPWPVGGTS